MAPNGPHAVVWFPTQPGEKNPEPPIDQRSLALN